ncbi:MAG: formate dehydrogenase subunit alpha [Thermodesulfovibrionales bacterium]|nr:formate dehydrogenase subunit alpha [Thermodesulfovibrionales bacterium]
MVTLTIDGKKVTVRKLSTVLDAARKLDIPIPTLCHHSELSPYGGCRLCIVEIKGMARPITACTTPVSDGMEVITTSPYIEKLRKTTLELLLSDHPNDCMVCERAGDCTLQELAYFYGIRENRFEGERRFYTRKDNNPFIEREMEKCILCGQCVRICDEIQGVGAIDFAHRGFKTRICPPYEKDLNCEFCGQCVAVCPTGALTGKMWAHKGRQKDIKEIETVCPYCGCGCSLTLHVRRNEVIRVSSREDTINEGWLCAKGRFGYGFINHPDRLTKPLIRIVPKNSQKSSARGGRSQKTLNSQLSTLNSQLFREVSWDEALVYVAKRLREIKDRYGPDSIGGLSSAKCTNEENYLFQKFMRAVIGTNNVDHCVRYCHSSTLAGLATVFGSGAMTNSIPEIGNHDVIFVIGSNTTETHPIIGLRIKKAVRGGAELIVADPRRIDLVRFAGIWLQHRPGTDVALLKSMMHVIVKEDLTDKKFIEEWTEGFESFKEGLNEYTPDMGEKITGVPKEYIIRAAILYGNAVRPGIYYTMGITQHTHGTENVFAIAKLALMTGNIGRESTGVNPLRGQNNVQGASDMGCFPDFYPGYQKVNIPNIKQKFEKAWGVRLSDKIGLTAPEMAEAALKGNLKAMYIMGENPVLSDPDINRTIEALKRLDFLAVQDIFMTETAELADVVLPAACFAEKDGTFTNTERRVQRVRKAVEPPGEAKEDSWIIIELANRLGYKMKHAFIEEVFQEAGKVWPAIEGITYGRIAKMGLQWPCPTLDHPGTPYLFKGGFPRGKAVFSTTRYRPSEELPDNEYPFLLSTGRQLFQYHTGSMTRKIDAINKISPEAYIEIHPDDAKQFGINDGKIIKVSSRRGSINIKALISDRPAKGMVFIPFHFKEAAANVLTGTALDPIAKIPELKVCAVKIEVVVLTVS